MPTQLIQKLLAQCLSTLLEKRSIFTNSLKWRFWSLASRRLARGWRLDNNTLADQFSLWITLSSFVIAVAVFLVIPFLALSWEGKPFPGFVVEQTGVIADIDGIRWSGRGAGLNYPERVIAINDQPVNGPGDFQEALMEYSVGQLVRVRTINPGGVVNEYPQVIIRSFPVQDLRRLFWLPYGIGLAFLLLGGWVFIIRGETRPGRAFAFFCISTAITISLLFDLSTTHALTSTWTIAISLVGGSLFSLAMLFPTEWGLVQRRAWLRFLPYLVSLSLGMWGLAEIQDFDHPWAYVIPWRYSYIYIAAGILTFLLLMLYRLRMDLSPVARQQARIILWGSLLSFIPLVVWVAAPFFGRVIPWNSGFFLPLLMFFPLSIGFAILRYRLWDIDVIVNRTLVYSALTVLLALIYITSVLLFEQLFRPFTRNNQLAAVISTLAIVALFNPLRQRVQEFIDIRFYRRKYDMAKTLSAFGTTLRDEVDLERLTGRLEEVIWETMQPSSVLTWLSTSNGYCVHSDGRQTQSGDWQKIQIPFDDPFVPSLRFASTALELEGMGMDSPARQRLSSAGVELILPLISQGELIGWLSLGRRLSQRDYSADDRALLTNLAAQAAPAVRVAQLVQKEQLQAVERERMEHELHLAQRIQLALLPKKLPSLDQWSIAAHYQPARAVGGDFYDFIPFEDGRLGILIGDVTGKGVPAALVMATTRSILRAVALQGLSPGEVLRSVNNQLELDIPDQMFVTCLYAILDPTTGYLRYANGGHNLPYHRSAKGLEELRVRGMPLGLMSNMEYEEKETCLNPGDFLVLHSDGLVEAHNPQRKMFGSQRLRSLVDRAAGYEMSLIKNLLHELAEFTGEGWDQEDDITLVILHRST